MWRRALNRIAFGEPLDKERSRVCRKARDYIRLNPDEQGAAFNSSQMPLRSIVLDTNVALDWLLFDDPSSRPFAAAIRSRQIQWIATRAMRAELAEVLRRGLAAQRCVDPRSVLAGFDDWTAVQPQPQRRPLEAGLVCTDADDQQFIDLAISAGARWLLSRDRAVLRLARRASSSELQIVHPRTWSAELDQT